jgi:F-type H+-transporting ATPase subunit delta
MTGRTTRVARRYAQAAFEVARERGQVDRWLAELERLVELLDRTEAGAFLAAPQVPFEAKQEFVERTLADFLPEVRNFVLLLTRRRRIRLLPRIYEEFGQLANEYRGIVVAEVTSAVPLDDADKAVIIRQLSELTGRRAILRTQVDPSILGGLIVRIGDKLIDGSLRTRLERLRETLTRG